ncbi:kelch repeat-containing protein [Oleiharenicola lentus]|uniref:kelch repeat-containing protein n=1 Tax=Oleiharenicola lentus TaxID=2508720 RepID=UPI003F66A43E
MSTLSLTSVSCAGEKWRLTWRELPALPPAPGQTKQAGLAGPYVGVHHDALLVAGGANFPVNPPWANGVKAWWDDILVLTKKSAGGYEWITDARFKLPRAMGYGMSFNTPEGVVCVGGADNDRCYADVFALAWNPATRTVTTTTLPSLPKPLSFMSGAMIGSTIYVAGGQLTVKDAQFANSFYALDLSKRGTAAFAWEELPAWPGPARILPIAAAQSNGKNTCFYLFSGRLPKAGGAAALLGDGYVYDPATKKWKTLSPPPGNACLMGATAIVEGSDEILLLGGDRGKLFGVLEAHDLKIAALRRELTAPGANQAALQKQIDTELQAKIKIYESHPGFSAEILAYHPRTDSWRVVGQMPTSSPVTTLSTKWGDAWIIPTGEEKPGIRTTRIHHVIAKPAGVK